MRNVLKTTAILALIYGTAVLASPATDSNNYPIHFTFNNYMSYPVTIKFFDFVGTWEKPIKQYYEVTLTPGQSSYQNTLTSDSRKDAWAGIDIRQGKTSNNYVTINADGSGANIVASAGSIKSITHVTSAATSAEENVTVDILK